MNGLVFVGIGYILGMPLLLRLVCVGHTQFFIKRKQSKLPRNKLTQTNLPKPLWPKIKERVKFTLKDTRGFQLGKPKKSKEGGLTNKQAIFVFWFAGLIISLAIAYTGNWKLLLFMPILFMVPITYSLISASPVIKGREQLYVKMYEIGKSTLGISAEYTDQPQAVIQVLEWREILKPNKVRFQIPTTFNADSSENFIRQFNQVFGTETTWVPFDDPETKKPGWNFAEGELTLKETPPLPQMAPWSEHYVLDPSVSWSFFPIALGVEDGIEVQNPKTGEMENVLGFDVSGTQPELSKKLGTYCSPTITTSPMALCFTGDTLIAMADGSFKSIESLAALNGSTPNDPCKVLSLDSAGNLVEKTIIKIRLTRHDADIVEIIFTDGASIRCTPDHLFRLDDGKYMEAQYLTSEEKLAEVDGHASIVKEVLKASKADVFDGEVPDTHNFIVAASKDDGSYSRVAVHNCAGGTGGGKSLAVGTKVRVITH